MTNQAVHLFLHYDVYGSLWQLIKYCIGVIGVEPNNIIETTSINLFIIQVIQRSGDRFSS